MTAAVTAQRGRWIEPEKLRPITLPGANLAWLVGAPGRPGMKREVVCRSATHPPAVVEHGHGKGRRDMYVRDDDAVTLTYRYRGTVDRLGVPA